MFRLEYLSSVVNVLTNSVKISDQTMQTFSNSIDLEFMKKSVNSCAVLTSAVFRTR